MVTEEMIAEKTLTPQEVRDILNTDNREIIRLCKKASIVPRKNPQGQTFFSMDEVIKLRKVRNQASKQEVVPVKTVKNQPVNSQAVVNNLISTLDTMEKKMTTSLSKLIDEKLDGMDEVVVELIRCKTENENLRQKINELNKENYHLKNKVKSFKSVGLGLYVKKDLDEFSL